MEPNLIDPEIFVQLYLYPRFTVVARVFTLACADEHLLRILESLVAVQ